MDILFFLVGFCVTDIVKKQISNIWFLICLLFGVLKIILNIEILRQAVGGLLMASIISYAIYFVSKGEMGMGDVKMLACIGFYIGFYNFIRVLFGAVLMAVIFGIILMFLKKANRKTEIPFAPFLTIAFLINVGVI